VLKVVIVGETFLSIGGVPRELKKKTFLLPYCFYCNSIKLKKKIIIRVFFQLCPNRNTVKNPSNFKAMPNRIENPDNPSTPKTSIAKQGKTGKNTITEGYYSSWACVLKSLNLILSDIKVFGPKCRPKGFSKILLKKPNYLWRKPSWMSFTCGQVLFVPDSNR